MEECGSLRMQHYFIDHNQRIQMYGLLLEAYLKKLLTTSSDRDDTQKTLETVSKTTEHAI